MKIRAKHIQKVPGDHLYMEVGSSVLVELDGLRRRFRTEFIGMERGKYILLRLPRNINLRNMLYKDRPVTLRFLGGGGRLSGFKSHVLNTMVTPYSLLFLFFPINIEVLNQRERERVTCFLPAALVQNSTETNAMITDISVSGCRVMIEAGGSELEMDTEEDADIQFLFRLFPEDEPIVINGRIKSTSQIDERLHIGAEFDTPPKDTRSLLDAYVSMVKGYLDQHQTPAN